MISRRNIFILVIVILTLWAAGAIVIVLLVPTWSDRANFGEMFGAVNSLFSGLALAGVVVAILLQRQELEFQRRELTLTRAELERTAASQEDTKRLSELRFLMDLAPHFSKRRKQSNEAWNTLLNIEVKITDSSDPKWQESVEALEGYYKSAQFLYQVAVLTNKRILDSEALYILYYDDISEHPDVILKSLAEWCGTGVELAANYTWLDVVRMADEIGKLLRTMATIRHSYGGETYDWQLKGILKVKDDLTKRGDPWIPKEESE